MCFQKRRLTVGGMSPLTPVTAAANAAVVWRHNLAPREHGYPVAPPEPARCSVLTSRRRRAADDVAAALSMASAFGSTRGWGPPEDEGSGPASGGSARAWPAGTTSCSRARPPRAPPCANASRAFLQTSVGGAPVWQRRSTVPPPFSLSGEESGPPREGRCGGVWGGLADGGTPGAPQSDSCLVMSEPRPRS